MKTFANELVKGDTLTFNQTFLVAEDSGLMVAGEWLTLDGSHDVVHVEHAGTDHKGVEQTRVSVRSRGVGLLTALIMPSARVVKTAA